MRIIYSMFLRFYHFVGGITRPLRKVSGILFYNHIVLPYLLARAKKKDVINVAFTAWNVGMWKYHSLYKLMEQHPRFNPFIVLVPSPRKDIKTREYDCEEMKRVFAERGYKMHPIIEWDGESFRFSSNINADIIFPTQPYAPGLLTRDICKYLFCYTIYAFPMGKPTKWAYDSFLENIFLKHFIATKSTLDVINEISFIKGKNCVVTGYLFGDVLKEKSVESSSVWKHEKLKKIIWAPHFSISNNLVLSISTFDLLSDVMVDIAEKYKDKVQFAFKPHPFLYNTLVNLDGWGEARANAYYEKWRTMDNGQLELGDYAELFKQSDGIIHDCGSFLIDYLYTLKPAFYAMRPDSNRSDAIVGQEAMACYYQGLHRDEIEKFIENVVLGGDDPLKDKRYAFAEKYLTPPNGKTAAENAMDALEKVLGWRK